MSYCLFCTGYLQISLRIIDKNVCNVANKCLNIGKCISANGKQIEKVKIGKRFHEGRGKGGKARGAMGRQGVEMGGGRRRE